MSPETGLRPRRRAPIALQIVVLMLAGMLASQVVTVAIVLFMPSRPPRDFPAREVVTALEKGVPGAHSGLVVTLQAAPPPTRPERVHRDEAAEAHLAALMQKPSEQVRFFYVHDPRWIEAIKNIWRPQRRPPGGPGSGRFGPGRFGPGRFGPGRFGRDHFGPGPFGPGQFAPGQFGPGQFGPGQFGPGMPPPFGGPPRFVRIGNAPYPIPLRWLTDPAYPFGGDFLAAAQRPSGVWATVRPTSPSPFDQWQGRLLLWLAGSALVIAPAGYFFAGRITAPLAQFAQAARRLGSDPRSSPAQLEGPAEVGLAADAFNDMQARIQRYIADRTTMFTAISHDLRTPLARMRFKLERAPPETAHALAGDIEQMEQMIASVLTFMREGQSAGPRHRLDLQSLLEVVVDETVHGGGEATIQDGPALTVFGDVEALKRLFTNLIGNAVAYGARAAVMLRREGDEARVEIRDQGPGLPQTELERVFEPFYRADRARNLNAGGMGLGLAISRSIALEHGGNVHLEAAAPGLKAIVRLPLDLDGPRGEPPAPSPVERTPDAADHGDDSSVASRKPALRS